MSNLNESELAAWQTRRPTAIRHELSDGRVCYLQRPSPALALKTGKIQRLLNRLKDAQGQSQDQAGWAFLEALSNEEADKLATQAVELICDVMVEPKLHRNPVGDQLGILSLGNDFWPLYFKALGLFADAPVKTVGGETTVEAVETFPEGQTADANAGNDVGEISSPPC